MSLISSIVDQNVLVFNNQCGGGHKSTVESVSKDLKLKNNHVIVKDIFDPLPKFISSRMINYWNNSMKNEDVKKLNSTLKFQSVGEFLLSLPEIITITIWLLRNKIDNIINPQPMFLQAIVKSARLANFINKAFHRDRKEILIHSILTELPTNKTLNYFNTLNKLSKNDRKICKLISTKPLLFKNDCKTEKQFWKKHTGFDAKNVIYDELPIRKPFFDYANVDPAQITTLNFQINHDKAQKKLKSLLTNPNKLKLGKNSIEIKPTDSVGAIMLGSQAGRISTLKYVSDLIKQYKKNENQNGQNYLFVFTGDHNDNNDLFDKVCKLIRKNQKAGKLPSKLTIVPLENQKAEEVAPILRKSNFTITRSGGLTCMELYKVSSGQIYIHSTKENPIEGVPIWEYGNARYLQETKGAEFISPSKNPFSKETKGLPGFSKDVVKNTSPKLGKQTEVNLRIISHTDETFEWKKKLIETAEQSVEISLNYARGKSFRELLQVIEKRMKQRPNLKVHLICAESLLEDQDKKDLEYLSKCSNFNCLITQAKLSLNSKHGLGTSENHVKLLVVDEKYFVLGGSSVTDSNTREKVPEYHVDKGFINNYLPNAYRDEDIVGEGKLAERMRLEFFKLYNIWEINTYSVAKASYFPISGTRGTNTEFEQSPGLFSHVKAKLFVGGPEHKENNPITKAHLDFIHSARKMIRVAGYQFNPDRKLQKALAQKKDDNVRVTGQFNHRVQKGLLVIPSRANYDCFENVYEYSQGSTCYHKKITLVDNKRVLIGSYNYNQKSAFYDHDIALEIDDNRCASHIARDLDEDLKFSIHYKPKLVHKVGGFILGPLINNFT